MVAVIIIGFLKFLSVAVKNPENDPFGVNLEYITLSATAGINLIVCCFPFEYSSPGRVMVQLLQVVLVLRAS
jgi:hypothetical protein